ncbi:hypothetical protein OROMI_026389 [Orobanche minor]
MTSSRRLLFSSPSLSTTTATTVVPIFFGPQPQCSPPRLIRSRRLKETWFHALEKLDEHRNVVVWHAKYGYFLFGAPALLQPLDYVLQHRTWVMMNRVTRRLGKIPDEVKKEDQPFYLNRAAISTKDTDIDKIEKLTDENAEIIHTGLVPRWSDMDANQPVNNVKYNGWLLEAVPRWSDMDANQHVNNVKYIGWLLESVPINVLEDYNMKRMTLEYRRECRQSNLLEFLTSMKAEKDEAEDEEDRIFSSKEDLECRHLLRMEADQVEIVRARSVWRIKQHDHIII